MVGMVRSAGEIPLVEAQGDGGIWAMYAETQRQEPSRLHIASRDPSLIPQPEPRRKRRETLLVTFV